MQTRIVPSSFDELWEENYQESYNNNLTFQLLALEDSDFEAQLNLNFVNNLDQPMTKDKSTLLMMAIFFQKQNKVAAILEHPYCLKNPGYLNRINHRGLTALMIACGLGNNFIVKQLIHAEAEINKQDSKGRSALFIASSQGHAHIAPTLVNAGANFEMPNNEGITPLMNASNLGYLAFVRVMLTQGAQLDTVNFKGESALYLAVKGEHLPVIEFLLSHEAAINPSSNNRSNSLLLANDKLAALANRCHLPQDIAKLQALKKLLETSCSKKQVREPAEAATPKQSLAPSHNQTSYKRGATESTRLMRAPLMKDNPSTNLAEDDQKSCMGCRCM